MTTPNGDLPYPRKAPIRKEAKNECVLLSVSYPSSILVDLPIIVNLANDDGDVHEPSAADSDNDKYYVPPVCGNIDEAMASLHSSADGVNNTLEIPSSYIPSVDYDWLLDGIDNWKTDAACTQQLLGTLYELQFETVEQIVAREAKELEHQEAEHDNQVEDEDFGEFQSAELPTHRSSPNGKRISDDNKMPSSPNIQGQLIERGSNERPDEKSQNDGTAKEGDGASRQTDEGSSGARSAHSIANTQFSSEIAEREIPLSLQLPITDMSTIENRFVRRLQKNIVANLVDCEDEAEDEKDSQLDVEFVLDQYGQDSEETVDVLKGLPWKFVPYWKCYRLLQQELDERFVPVMHEHLTTELSTLDAALAQVHAHLLRQIQPHKPELESANEIVHKLHQDTTLALMYVQRSRESIRQIRGDRGDFTGSEGSIALVEAWDLRDQYVALDRILKKVAHLLESEKSFIHQIESFDPQRPNAMNDCRRIITIVHELNSEANDKTMSKLTALDSLRERTTSAISLFRDRIDVLLTQVVAKSTAQGTFWKGAYETLLLARFDVERYQNTTGARSMVDDTDAWKSFLSSWSQKVIDSLCYEVDRAFARALLDPSDFRESLYDKELMELSIELGHDGADAAKLRTVTHNLVTIRFNFEAEEYYLPWVYRKLCALLTDVLYTLYNVLQWHKSRFESADWGSEDCSKEFDRLIFSELKTAVSTLWERCEAILVRCLDEYLHLATKTKFFHGDDDRNWARDLECLRDVLQLTQQFLIIGKGFHRLFQLEGAEVTALGISPKEETPLQRKLCDVFRRHLRNIHVEAMNTFGATLAREDWTFVSISIKSGGPWPVVDQKRAIKKLMAEMIQKSDITLKKFSPQFRLLPFDSIIDVAKLFSEYDNKTNPFLQDDPGPQPNGFKPGKCQSDELERESFHDNNDTVDFETYELVGSLLTIGDADLRIRSCKAVSDVLTVWFSRLLTVSRFLPLVAEDVSIVFAHLCDLYLTTVLRLCAKNAKNEKIILGFVSPNPIVTTSPRSTAQRSGSLGSNDQPLRSSPLFGFRRRQQQQQPKQPVVRSLAMVSATTEADACYPPLTDMGKVAKLRKFIVRGQESLGNVVNFDMVDDWLPDVKLKESESWESSMKLVTAVLNKRVCAAMSSLVVAVLMDAVRFEVVKLCCRCSLIETKSGKGGDNRTNNLSAVAAFSSYVDALLLVIPKFIDVAIQISCAHAVFTRSIVSQIISVGAGWEEAKLNEHPNDYIDDVCQRFSLLWANLQPSTSKLPTEIVRSLWEKLLQAGFLALLEGFSRVMHCSTEGRSLMTMDLAAFVSGTEPWAVWERLPNHEEFGPPPSVSTKRGSQYVDTYIKMFYFPLEDIKDWIAANYTKYQQNHTVALISGASNSSPQDRQEIIRFVKNLYLNFTTNTDDHHEDPPSLCRHASC